MTRPTRDSGPIQKQPRGQSADHSPRERRHAHPSGAPGMDASRAGGKQQHKK